LSQPETFTQQQWTTWYCILAAFWRHTCTSVVQTHTVFLSLSSWTLWIKDKTPLASLT